MNKVFIALLSCCLIIQMSQGMEQQQKQQQKQETDQLFNGFFGAPDQGQHRDFEFGELGASIQQAIGKQHVQLQEQLQAMQEDEQMQLLKEQGIYSKITDDTKTIESWTRETPIKGFLGLAWKKNIDSLIEITYNGKGITGNGSKLSNHTEYCLKAKIIVCGLIGVGLAGLSYLVFKNQISVPKITVPKPQQPTSFLASTWNRLTGKV